MHFLRRPLISLDTDESAWIPMSPLISLDTDESLRWRTGLERVAAELEITEWGRTGRCVGAERVAESWQHCVEIWVERDAGCSGLRGPSCRAVSHVACAPAVAPWPPVGH